MSKKRNRPRNEGPSGSQAKISKFFGHKTKRAVNVTEDFSDNKSEVPDEKRTKTFTEQSEVEECIHLLPETSQRLKNFAFSDNRSSREAKAEKYEDVEIKTFKENSSNCQEKRLPDLLLENEGSSPDKSSPENPADSKKSQKQKYTPLEVQYLDLKKDYADAILFIQCGYKYRIFGEDAQIASKILGFGCYMNHNLYSSSFPVQRLAVHVRRLVSKGYKVGVVNQTETAAIKAAGDSKNTLFSRKLHALYTQSTLIGEGFHGVETSKTDTDDLPAYETPSVSGYLMSICDEEKTSNGGNIANIGILAVNISTGDVFYDSFDDSLSRSKLEASVSFVCPSEILLPESSLTSGTENFIKSHCETCSLIKGRNIRVERKQDQVFDYFYALTAVTQFYSNKEGMNESSEDTDKDNLKELLSLPPLVLCCLSSIISYLKEFNLETIVRGWRHFAPLFNSSHFMNLNATTVRNLELLNNSVDYGEEGSLFWTINSTTTRFGEKLLKSWLLKPLKSIEKIDERLECIGSVIHSDCPVWAILQKMLLKLPNLERLLCSAFYHRCSCTEFLNLAKTLMEIKNTIISVQDAVCLNVKAQNLKDIICDIPFLLENIETFVTNIDEKTVRNEDKTKIFIDTSGFPKVIECNEKIKQVVEGLEKLKIPIAKTLRVPAFQYTEVMGQKYLIEVKNNMCSVVPKDWLKINSTKQLSRFRSPEVSALCVELQKLKEELDVHCNEAWNSFLNIFGTYFYKYKKAVSHLAELDCIFSLAKLAKQDGYCRPVVIDDEEHKLEIVEGRNPIVCKLLGEKQQYVANGTNLNCNKRCMIITGPNMGGKSSYVRQVALIAVLAQIGSYVPAASATLPLFDGVHVRMGAEDDIFSHRSTFMTEMCETSTILSSASKDSLVILDELGRGTSTHDGAAIAHAVLHHLLTEIKCMTLFVTHYPQIASELEESFPENVYTCHMAFFVEPENEDNENGSVAEVTFLYNITDGVALKSYGINVARLAGIPNEILTKAKHISIKLEQENHQRRSSINVQKVMSTNYPKTT